MPIEFTGLVKTEEFRLEWDQSKFPGILGEMAEPSFAVQLVQHKKRRGSVISARKVYIVEEL